MLHIPIMPIIQAYYASDATSHQMCYREYCLKGDFRCTCAIGAGVKKSEFFVSSIHAYHYKIMGLFRDETDVALAISSDGDQLTMKKQFNMWLLIIVLLNLPPEVCYI